MRNQQITYITAGALLALAASACGTETGSGPGDPAAPDSSVQSAPALTGVHWSVDSVTVDGAKTAAPAGAGVEINSTGRASASTGCNTIGAQVTVKGDTVVVGKKESTLIGCPEELAAFEKRLNGAFSGKLTAKVADQRLTLTGADGDTIALTAEKDAALTGTKWVVTSLVDHGTVSSPAGREDRTAAGAPSFTLTKDGSVQGTGLRCNSWRTTAHVVGSTVTFGKVTSTKMACDTPASAVEKRLSELLGEGEVGYELAHRSLTLTGQDGQGVRAETAPAAK